jgi:acyl carrier protein
VSNKTALAANPWQVHEKPRPSNKGANMEHFAAVKSILSNAFEPAVEHLNADSALMGSVAKRDAIISMTTARERHFGLTVDDDEISARHFATAGSLASCVQQEVAA